MKKHVVNVFEKNHYLLGETEDGQKYWLTEPSWEGDWYWSFGIVVGFTNNRNPARSKDITFSSPWQYAFGKEQGLHTWNKIRSVLKERTLSDDDLWKLCDYMASCITLGNTAELYYTGNSHCTSDACLDELERPAEYEYINQVLLPKLFEKISELLSEEK